MITVLFMLYALNEITPIPPKFFVIAWVLFGAKVICELYEEKNKRKTHENTL